MIRLVRVDRSLSESLRLQCYVKPKGPPACDNHLKALFIRLPPVQIDALLHGWGGQGNGIGTAAARGLQDMGRVVMPALRAALKAGGWTDGGVERPVPYHNAVTTLTFMGQAVVPDLVAMLKSGGDDEVEGALDVLDNIGPPAEAGMPIVDCLERGAVQVREAAANALARMSCPPTAAVPGLMKLAGDEANPNSARGAACHALAAIGADAAPAIPVLEHLIKARDPQLSAAAKAALAKIRPTS